MFSLILPTYNEAENIADLLGSLRTQLQGLQYEIIVVDDNSPDGTWKVVQDLSVTIPEVRIVRRVGRRGLSSAVVEGFLAAKGNVLMVADADGQHDYSLIPKMQKATEQGADIVIGSRYTEGGSVGDWDERRFFLSRLATQLAVKLCKVKVADPMSGFFAVKRSVFESVLPKLNPTGFKILLDILVRVPGSTVTQELPFTFGERLHGESKLSRRVQLEFIEYLYEATVGKYIPLTFIKYAIVGSLGVFVHLATFLTLQFVLGTDHTVWLLSTPVLGAIEVAILFNFWLNNQWTFSSARLTRGAALLGLLKYNAACLFGALANYAIFALFLESGFTALLSTAVGGIVGMMWNYTMSRQFTWRA